MDLNSSMVSGPAEWVSGFLAQYGHSLWTLAVVLVGGAVCLKLTNTAITAIESKQKSPTQLTSILRLILRWLIVTATLMIGLQQIGVNIASLWGVVSAIVAMVAIGFVAVWSVLSNLLCTVVLVLMHPFRIGDEVEIIDPAATSGIKGKVTNINFVFTELDCASSETNGNVLFVPNNLFFQKVIRRHIGRNTYALDSQLFEEKTLLGGERTGD